MRGTFARAMTGKSCSSRDPSPLRPTVTGSTRGRTTFPTAGNPGGTILERCNAEPREIPLGLLPAWRLYRHPTYELLFRRIGPERLYVLSAGWGLVRADFLVPNYDITFSKAGNVPKFKRRGGQDVYNDFELPSGIADPLVFFGGRDYIPLFTKLTARAKDTPTRTFGANAFIKRSLFLPKTVAADWSRPRFVRVGN